MSKQEWPKDEDRISDICPVCKESVEVRREDPFGDDFLAAKKALELRIKTHHCKNREDFSQAAARIVREATENK